MMHGGNGKELLVQSVQTYYKATAAINLSGCVIHNVKLMLLVSLTLSAGFTLL